MKADYDFFLPASEMISSFKILVIFLLSTLSVSFASQVTSATYQIKTTHLLGVDYEHAILEFNVDDDVYYSESWPCSCVATRSACSFSTNISVAEPEGIATLTEGVWYTVRSQSLQDFGHFKFELLPEAYTVCPIIIFEVVSLQGELHTWISNQYIPNATTYQWQKLPQSNSDSRWTCPTDKDFSFGTYYVTVGTNPPESNELSYKIRVVTLSSVPCTNLTLSAPAPQGASWIALNDTWAFTDIFPFGEYRYFRLSILTECTNFAFVCRQVDITQYGDCDVFASTIHPLPKPDGGEYEWMSQINDNDAIYAHGVCRPANQPGTTPWKMYFMSYSWLGDFSLVEVVASTRGPFLTRSLHDLPAYQISQTLAHMYATLECGVPPVTEKWDCGYPAYLGSNDPFDPYEACSPFYPIAPTSETRYGNHIFPENKAIPSLAFLRTLPWTNYANETSNQRRKIMYAVLLSIRSATFVRQYVQFPITECTVTFHNMYTNALGEPLTGSFVLNEQKLLTCDMTEMEALRMEALSLIRGMQSQMSLDALFLSHTQLAFLTLTDTWQGCLVRLGKQFTSLTVMVSELPRQTSCEEAKWSDRYFQDPCCARAPSLNTCCFPSARQISISAPSVSSVTTDVSYCARKYYEDYALQTLNQEQCVGTWQNEASAEAIDEMTTFIKDCRVDLLGYYHMEGISCSTVSDCKLGALCNLMTKRCEHNYTHVIDCWANGMPSSLGNSLFAYWRIKSAYNVTIFKEAVNSRLVRQFCTGAKGLDYRKHYRYIRDTLQCTDDCYDPIGNIDMEPRCFEQDDATYCPVPANCLQTGRPGECLRRWSFIDGLPLSDCEQQLRCNWMSCEGLSATQCQAQCVNSNISSHVCLSCQNGICNAVPPSTQTACEQIGVCDLNTTITDPQTCTALRMTTPDTCEGMPTGGMISSVGCFTPYDADFFGFPSCPSNTINIEVSFGCLQPNVTNVTSCSGRWVNITACNTQPIAACYNPAFGISDEKTLNNCTQCQQQWNPILEFRRGSTRQGRMIPGIWVQRKSEPIRSLEMDLDYLEFDSIINRAVISKASLSFSTLGLCQHASKLDSMLLASCGASLDEDTCFSSITAAEISRQIAVGQVCPFSETNLTTHEATLLIEASIIPSEIECGFIELYLTPASLFERSREGLISSQIFIRKELSSLAVVTNNKTVVVGQLVTHGVEVKWDINQIRFTGPLHLCIPMISDVHRDPKFSVPAFARLSTAGRSIQPVAVATIVSANRTFICGSVLQPGTYFGVFHRASSDLDSILIYGESERIQAAVSTALYCIVILVSLYQAGQFIRLRYLYPSVYGGGRFILKIGILSVVVIYSLCRTLFFGIPPELLFSNIGSVVLFELPTTLFFIMYTSVIHLWIETIYRIKSIDTSRAILFLKGYLILNGVMIVSFIVFIVAFFTVEEDQSSPCELLELNVSATRRSQVNLAYLIFIAILAMIMAVIYMVVGLYFIIKYISKSKNHCFQMGLMTGIIMSTFVSMFLVRSSLMLYAALTARSYPVPILVFSLLEILPSLALLYYILPPERLRDIESAGSTSGARLTTKSSKTSSTESPGPNTGS